MAKFPRNFVRRNKSIFRHFVSAEIVLAKYFVTGGTLVTGSFEEYNLVRNKVNAYSKELERGVWLVIICKVLGSTLAFHIAVIKKIIETLYMHIDFSL